MQDIFDIKFPIELSVKENVILKFSNKQGGAYNIFSYYWQCFVWAATIGFLRNERRALAPGTERIFSLNTMVGNGGEKDARALICLCIARTGSLDIMKTPEEAIKVISEYANGGFYHIMTLMANGENTFNDLEKVKQEIFSRDYDEDTDSINDESVESDTFPDLEVEIPELDEEAMAAALQDIAEDTEATPRYQKVRSRWTVSESKELENYFKQGMTVEQLSAFLGRPVKNVTEQLQKMNLI